MSKTNKQQRNTSLKPEAQQEPEKRKEKYAWMPFWGWVLLFLVPLIMSLFMFYMAGRWFSMILFPIAWVGFWVITILRSGSTIFKKREKK